MDGLPGGGNYCQSLGINSAMQVVGVSWVDNGQHIHAFVWQSGQTADLGVLPGFDDSTAWAINDAGHVVGGVSGKTEDAVLWVDGTPKGGALASPQVILSSNFGLTTLEAARPPPVQLAPISNALGGPRPGLS
jgi:probable HAF family extracellular repeat protein